MMSVLLRGLRLVFSQTAKDTYWVFGGNVLASFLAFLYTIFLARKFSPSEFGIFSAIIAFIWLVADVCDLGIGSSLSRFLPPLLARGERRKTFSFIKTAFVFQMKVTIIVVLAIIIFSSVISGILLRDSRYSVLYILSAFGVLGMIILAFSSFVLSAHKRFKEVAILNSLSTAAKFVFVLSLFFSGLLNITSAIAVFAFSSFIAYMVALKFFPLAFLKVREEKDNLKKLLSYSLFVGASRVFSAIGSRLDALMLIPLSSTFEAGIYSAAYKIVFLYTILASSFGMVIAPRLSSYSKLSEAVSYIKKVILVVVGILATMIIMYFIAPWFVVFILGSKYALSIPVFQLLLIPMAFFIMNIPTVNFLLYTLKKPQVSTFNTFMQLVIILAGNLILIPRFCR